MKRLDTSFLKTPKFVFLALFMVASLLTMAMVSADSASSYDDELATYRVTFANFSTGQPFTPPLVATHERRFKMFRNGREASIGVQEIAENGNLGPMIEILENDSRVTDFVVAVAGDPPPLTPGGTVSIEITAHPNDRLSFVAMLICTNDGFVGRNSLKLPTYVGQTKSIFANAYDAGTEINTEDFADLVPPCPALTGVDSDDAGTGASNPALAENGVIGLHWGVEGGNDLIPALHDWYGRPVAVQVTRLD